MFEIFPPANLPDRATAWGRAVESGIVSSESQVLTVERSIDNWRKFMEGQLGVSGRSLEEITARSTDTQILPNISVTGSAQVEPFPRQNITVTFPADSRTRNSFVSVSGVATNSRSDIDRLYVYLIYRGSIIGGSWAQPFTPFSTPTEWQNQAPIFVGGNIQTQANEPAVVTVRAVRASDIYTAPGTSTLTLEAPTVALTRGSIEWPSPL